MEALKLNNGHKIIFVEKLKGKHYIAVQSSLGELINVDMSTGEQSKANMGLYLRRVAELFPLFVDRVEDANGNEIPASYSYYEELDFEDADVVFDKLSSLIGEITKKKSAKKN